MPKFIVRFSYNYSMEAVAATEEAMLDIAGQASDEFIKAACDFDGMEIDVEQVD